MSPKEISCWKDFTCSWSGGLSQLRDIIQIDVQFVAIPIKFILQKFRDTSRNSQRNKR